MAYIRSLVDTVYCLLFRSNTEDILLSRRSQRMVGRSAGMDGRPGIKYGDY